MKTTLPSALALALLAAACGQEVAADRAETEAPAAEAAPLEDRYADLSEPPAEPEALPDPYEADDDPVASALAGLDEATSASDGIGPETIGEEEVARIARDEFALADTDGDGALSREEYLATMVGDEALAGAPGIGADPVVEDEPLAAGGEVAAGELSVAEYLTAKFEVIAGPDDAVSLDELETATREDFAAADEDGDAVLTGEEADAFAALRTGRQPAY